MANNFPTVLDIAKLKGSDPTTGLINETIFNTPEIVYGAARSIKGRNYKTSVLTALPSVSFRAANQGSASVKSICEQRQVETFNLNPQWFCDVSVADGWEDGASAYIAMEAMNMTKAGWLRLSTQMWYGHSNLATVVDPILGALGDAQGFPGVMAAYDSTDMVVNAGGTSANTGSSAWLVTWGPQNLQWVYGQDGSLEITDLRTVSVADTNGNYYSAYHQELKAYPGLQVGSLREVARIYNLTADSGCGLTDKKLFDALALFPASRRPNAIYCTRRSLAQLRESRTAVNTTGAPAPTPTEIEGIPIYPTDALSNVETLSVL